MTTQDPIERFVGERLKAEHDEATRRTSELKARPQPVSDDDLAYFFPEFHGLYSWSNLPRMDLPHYLILGMPAVFDLEPLDPDLFKQTYRIDIETATDLAKDRYLLPNLYVRDPARWRGRTDFEGLLKLALVNGERVEAYLRARDGRFDQFLSDRQKFFREDFLVKTWPTLDTDIQQKILQVSRPKSPEDMPKVLGTRWAYLDVLAPRVSAKLEELFKEQDYLLAFQVHRGAKHLIASPFTAALGGDFVCGPEELRVINIAREHGVEAPRELDEEIRALEAVLEHREARQAIEYFVQEITKIKPFRVLHAWEMGQLRRVIEDEEMRDFKRKMYDALKKMLQLARESGNLDPQVAEFRKMVREFQRRLDSYQKGIGAVVDLANFGLGGLVGAYIGGVSGGISGAIIGGTSSLALLKDAKEALGAELYRFMNRDRHLVLTTVQKLRDMDQGE